MPNLSILFLNETLCLAPIMPNSTSLVRLCFVKKFFVPCSKKTTVGATLVVAQMVALIKKNLNYKGWHKTCPYKIHLDVLQDAIVKNLNYKGWHKTCPYKIHLDVLQDAIVKNLNYKGWHKTCPYKINLGVLQDAVKKKIYSFGFLCM